MLPCLAFLASLLMSPLAAAEPPPLLSGTGLYSDIAAKQVDPANELFEPQYPFWSDGAVKTRWIRLPPGASIDTADMDRWVLPVGTRFWKEFAFRDEKGALHRVETRFMEKRGPDDWSFASYAWNAEETEAARAPEGGLDDIFPIGGGLKHDIPSAGECRFCHARGGDSALGFDALQLSTDRDDPLGPGLNLETLAARGLLTRAPRSRPRIAGSPAARAARGYLHGNCGHCHNPQGTAFRSGLFLRHQIEGAPQDRDQPIFQTAVGKKTAYFRIPGQAETFRIKPGDPNASAVSYRMGQRGGYPQMPPAGTKRADPDGLRLVLKWIEELGRAEGPATKSLRLLAEKLRVGIAEMGRGF